MVLRLIQIDSHAIANEHDLVYGLVKTFTHVRLRKSQVSRA